LKWFHDNELDAIRKVFKIALLEQALVQAKPPGKGDFRKRYWSISQGDEYRGLRMPEHGGNVYFHCLPYLNPRK
jgi:hypothetical protein